jgi:hypothetical protein
MGCSRCANDDGRGVVVGCSRCADDDDAGGVVGAACRVGGGVIGVALHGDGCGVAAAGCLHCADDDAARMRSTMEYMTRPVVKVMPGRGRGTKTIRSSDLA